ncbi:glycosyltransferase [Flavobacterium myungsuense]|uniref:Glycosyltransferase n=1 Tax=Flavobacterium myungsuense TaxID=651823 RepID=A0ABW3J0B8_9FLAO
MIHIVIPVLNRWYFTASCLHSIYNQSYKNFLVIVVDHGSTDGTSEKIRSNFPQVVLLKGDNGMWWTAATNLGVLYAINNNADYVLTLNNDLIVYPNYLENLVSAIQKHPNSILGSISLDKNNPEKIVFAGTKWNPFIAKYRSTINLQYSWGKIMRDYFLIRSELLPGRGTLIPIEVFKKIGLFDEVYFPHYAADEDFSLRCQKEGYDLFVVANAAVLSEIDATGIKSEHQKKTPKYYKDLLLSQKSPVNLKLRWSWARKNSPIPFVYFFIDYMRIIGSEIKKSILL